jgi:YVTN family beta-propeller protein
VKLGVLGACAAIQLACASAHAAPRGHERVYVQATMSRDIYVVDAKTFEITAHIPIGDYTDDVIGSPDGKVAFANAQISSGNPLSWQTNEAGKVMAIDTTTQAILWSTAVEGSPHHLSVDPTGSRVFVPLFDRNYLVVLDAHSGQLLARWYATLGNHSTEVSKDGRRLYVGNMVSDAIWVYDTQTGRIVQALRTGEAVRPLHLDGDQTHIVYQLSRFHGFKVRDLASEDVRSVSLPALPKGTEEPAYPYSVDHGLAFTPDHRKLLAAGSTAGYVAVYSAPDYRLLGVVKVGDDPNWIAVRGDSKIAFVSNRGSDTLSVIDIDALKELKQIPVGKMPQRLSVIDVPDRP